MVSTESAFVFNIVWTGTVFPYLRHFVSSQLTHSGARFRFVANACPPDQIELMEAFAAQHPTQVDEVLVVSTEEMIPHGAALERVRAERDDGDWFCLIDSDIRATGSFVGDFSAVLAAGCSAVTSGRGVWSETDVVPEGHAGVNGEYFWSADGFLFGSPHFAMYRREAIDAVAARWGVGFASGGPDLSSEATAALEAAGLRYWLWDTGKLLNVFLQLDGHRVCHHEHPNLMHIGGMSHYLSPPDVSDASVVARMGRVDRSTWDADRLEVAGFSAEVLMAAADSRPVPEVPAGLAPDMARKLAMVRTEILALVGSGDGT
jgi:hypothetical protein